VDRTFLKRLTVGHAAIVVVIVLSTTTALLALRATMRQTERTSEIDRRLALVDHLRSDARELARSARRYLLTGDLKEQQRVFAIESEMDGERLRLGPRARQLDSLLDNYVAAVVRNMTVDRTDAGAALATFEDALIAARSPLSSTFDEIIEREHKLREASRSSQWWARGAQWTLLVAAALAVLLTVGGIIAIIRALRGEAKRTRTAEAVAERAANARKELLAASNELRAPLSTIKAEAAMLRDAARDEQLRSLSTITSAASQLDNMLRQLLDVTAIQAGTVTLRREPCDVATLVDRAIKQHREQAHERGIRLRFEAQLAMSVSADRQRIVHVLATLLGVAIRTARIGAELVLSATPCDDGVRFAIIDAGVSVAMPEMFQPAVGAVPDDLALQLTQRVVEAHGGRMGIDTATAGRTYWFTLPTEPSVLR